MYELRRNTYELSGNTMQKSPKPPDPSRFGEISIRSMLTSPIRWRGGGFGAFYMRAASSAQRTAERVNTRIEIAVSATAHTATTARLSHASRVTLCMPQMSCSPLPLGSRNP
jgi:hypothetical protein